MIERRRTEDHSPDLVQTPLVENMVVGVPPVFTGLSRELGTLSEQPLLGPKADFPKATFASARKDVSGSRRPQAIAHRGYKSKYPENTLGAFKGAVDVGAEALETDIHLTKDGVVVLSHDADLKRCFGREEKIIDCDYEFLKSLKTLKEPHEPMPRLSDLLHYLAQPGLEDIWVLLDIKLDNNADDVMRLIASTINSVPPSPTRSWSSRIVLGIWAAKFLPLSSRYLPGFPVSHIGFSVLYASHFFSVPNVSFNMLIQVLQTPWGRLFIRKAHRDQRPVYAWTVNKENGMRWAIKHNLDGVITDDPKLFLEVRRSWHEGVREGLNIMMWLDVIRINLFALVFGFLFWMKFDSGGNTKQLIRSSVRVQEVEE